MSNPTPSFNARLRAIASRAKQTDSTKPEVMPAVAQDIGSEDVGKGVAEDVGMDGSEDSGKGEAEDSGNPGARVVETRPETVPLSKLGNGLKSEGEDPDKPTTTPQHELAPAVAFAMSAEGMAQHNQRLATMASEAMERAFKLNSIEIKKVGDLRVLDDLYRRATGLGAGGAPGAAGVPMVSVSMLSSIGNGAAPERQDAVRVEVSNLGNPVTAGDGGEVSAGGEPVDS